MILQIPVEGGYTGGQLTVEHHRKIRSFDLSNNSHSNFYITMIHAGSHLEIQPVDGWRIELIFHLMWKSPMETMVYPPLLDISSFLVALTKIKRDLKCWLEQSDDGGPSKMLVIGLENNYDPKYHSFTSLLGHDRSVANLMLTAGVMEVHLARLTKKVTGSVRTTVKLEEDPKDRRRPKESNAVLLNEDQQTVHTASHWIGVDNLAVQFHGLNIDTQTQFAGSVFKPDVQPDQKKSVEDPISGNTIQTSWYYQSVIIIWPKSKSLYFNLRHRFEYLLDQMEHGPITESTKTLKIVVSRSSEWSKSELRIYRLLNLSLRCQSKEEALQLLQLLVDNSMGIPNEDAARLLAELECKLLGWTSCKELIGELMMCKPVEQICYFATLSEAFFDRGALDGFHWVSTEIWKIFLSQISASTVFDRSGVVACAGVMVRVEERAEEENTERFNEFILYFTRLTVLHQCQIVLDLQKVCERSEPGLLLLLCLCFHIADNVDPFDKSLNDCLVDIVNCFATRDPHDPDVLDCFTKKICDSAKSPLLKKLASSTEMFELPNAILKRILDARISDLQSIRPPVFTWEQKEAKFAGSIEYPFVLPFLHSSEPTMTVSHFVHVQDARNFVKEHFGMMHICVQKGYSAMAETSGTGKATKCRIVKTHHLYLSQLKEFQANKEELICLFKRRSDLGLQTSDETLDDLMAALDIASDAASSLPPEDSSSPQASPAPKKRRVSTKKYQ